VRIQEAEYIYFVQILNIVWWFFMSVEGEGIQLIENY